MNRIDLQKAVEFIKEGLNRGINMDLACTPKYDFEGEFLGFTTFFIENDPLKIVVVNDPELQFATVISYSTVSLMDRDINKIIYNTNDYFINFDDNNIDFADDHAFDVYNEKYEEAKKPATQIWYATLENGVNERFNKLKKLFKIK